MGSVFQRLHLLEGLQRQAIPGLLVHLLPRDTAHLGMDLSALVHLGASDDQPVPAGAGAQHHLSDPLRLWPLPQVPTQRPPGQHVWGHALHSRADLHLSGGVWRQEGGPELGATTRHELPLLVLRSCLHVHDLRPGQCGSPLLSVS